MARNRRKPTEFHEAGFWQSYSDLMAGVLLMFILIICGTLLVLIQLKNSNEERELELNKAIELTTEQQSQLDEQQAALMQAESELDTKEAALITAQALLADQQTQLDDQQSLLVTQQAQLDEQQTKLSDQQTELDEKEAALVLAQALLATQQQELDNKEVQIQEQATALETQQAQLEQIIGVKRELISALSDEFSTSRLSITVDEQTGSITLDSSIIFDYDSAALTTEGYYTLYSFLPKYFAVVLSDQFIDYVSEIIIEGHTDTQGTYQYNLQLSEARAAAVAAYCLGDESPIFTEDQLARVRSLVSVTGRSWSNPIYNEDGTVNDAASRRVEIKFRLSDEEMISEMLNVLAQYETEDSASGG